MKELMIVYQPLNLKNKSMVEPCGKKSNLYSKKYQYL